MHPLGGEELVMLEYAKTCPKDGYLRLFYFNVLIWTLRLAIRFHKMAFGEDLTRDNLRKRHCSEVLWYVQTKWGINYLLVDCKLTRNLWVAILNTFRIERLWSKGW